MLADEENDALFDIRENWEVIYLQLRPEINAHFGNLQEISGYIHHLKKVKEKSKKYSGIIWSKLYLLDFKKKVKDFQQLP